jgi:hypothetical protein
MECSECGTSPARGEYSRSTCLDKRSSNGLRPQLNSSLPGITRDSVERELIESNRQERERLQLRRP